MAISSRKARNSKVDATPNTRTNRKKRSGHLTRVDDIGAAESRLFDRLKAYVRANASAYLEDPNVTSVGLGIKQSGGTPTGELSVQFTVRTKVVPQSLGALGSKELPKSIVIDGVTVPTDVLERSYSAKYTTATVRPKGDRRSRIDPVRPGTSIGGITTEGGTLGVFVRDRFTGRVVMLSNWHVLEGIKGKLNDEVVQPASFDDNRLRPNVVGRVLRSHVGPAGDCAIASLEARGYDNRILGLNVAPTEVGNPELDDRVVKSGRTTAVTFGRVVRLEVNTRITYGEGFVRVVGGFEIGPDDTNAPEDGEITRAGDSGAAWMAVDGNNKPIGVLLGINFAGNVDGAKSDEFALACYAESVFSKLELDLIPAAEPQGMAKNNNDALRTGFDREFLSKPIEISGFSRSRSKDLARLNGEVEIRYCHFSVWLSMSRRYPAAVAWNIDGSRYWKLNRASFRVDRRGDLESYQLTNEIYVDNALDRGHVARRADLCWGDEDEARQANYDSFFFTNIAPQHEAFNQSDNTDIDPEGGLWGRLENTIFDSERPHKLRVSLVGGPVIGRADRRFEQNGEQCYVPRDFWKVVAFVDEEDGEKLKVFSFLLTQAKLIKGLARPQGLNFNEWVWARIRLTDLEAKTGVQFNDTLHANEVRFVVPQSLAEAGEFLLPLFDSTLYFKA